MAGKHQTNIAFESLKGIDWTEKKILDIGCSNGQLTQEVARITYAKSAVGIDIDPKRIRKAQELKKSAGLKNFEFLLADASDLKIFSDQKFEAVFSNMTFQQLSDFRPALHEIYRVLKSGGQAVINFNQEKSNVWLEIEKLKNKYLNRINKLSSRKRISAKNFELEAQKTGFAQVVIKNAIDNYYYDTIDELVGNPENVSVVLKNYDLSDEQFEALWKELRNIFLAKKTNRGFKESWNMVYARLLK